MNTPLGRERQGQQIGRYRDTQVHIHCDDYAQQSNCSDIRPVSCICHLLPSDPPHTPSHPTSRIAAYTRHTETIFPRKHHSSKSSNPTRPPSWPRSRAARSFEHVLRPVHTPEQSHTAAASILSTSRTFAYPPEVSIRPAYTLESLLRRPGRMACAGSSSNL